MHDLRSAVHDHAALYNASVRSGDWSAFAATFTDDAVLRIPGAPGGPYEGPEAIVAAYAASPQPRTMTVEGVEELGPRQARVRFRWDEGGGGGTLTVTWRDGRVAAVTVALG